MVAHPVGVHLRAARRDGVHAHPASGGVDDERSSCGMLTFGNEELQRRLQERFGADLATVSRLLGHERLETTAIYTQPTAQDLEAAVRRLARDADQE